MSIVTKVSIAKPQQWFNVTEAAEYLQVSRQTIYKLMDAGLLPYYEVRGVKRRRIKKEDLDALFSKARQDDRS